MFRIKICGIKTIDDAQAAVDAGADAVGLNFYEKSRRYVETKVAADIARSLPADVALVGVFVNSSSERINDIAGSVGLQAIQLHGDEPPRLLKEISEDCWIVRARRWRARGILEVVDDLETCREAGRKVDAVLLDAAVAGQFGGTGSILPWSAMKDYRLSVGETPLILAGGLTPENVAEAIRIVQPHGVDVASGVEGSPGAKDHEKIHAFVQAARTAFAEAV